MYGGSIPRWSGATPELGSHVAIELESKATVSQLLFFCASPGASAYTLRRRY